MALSDTPHNTAWLGQWVLKGRDMGAVLGDCVEKDKRFQWCEVQAVLSRRLQVDFRVLTSTASSATGRHSLQQLLLGSLGDQSCLYGERQEITGSVSL